MVIIVFYILDILVSIQEMLLSFYKIIFDNAYGFVHINVILTNLMKVSILKSKLIYIRKPIFYVVHQFRMAKLN